MVSKSPFAQYEVSNFAMKGWESKHNSAYWDRTPYLGLGPAAHSFDGTHRSWNAPSLSAYFTQIAEQKPFYEQETLTDTDRYNEHLLLRLRTRAGIDLREMEALFGRDHTDGLLRLFETDVDTRHYECTPDRLHLTAEGLWFADGIAANAFLVI